MANFSKKIVSTVGAVTIVASSMSTSLVSAASEFLPYAETLAANKVIGTQSAEAGYRLNDSITRAELAKIAANLGQYNKVSCTGNVYSDVKANLGDLCDAIETLAAAGVVNKNASNFRPNQLVTRAEMTKMLLGALSIAPTSTSAGYADVTEVLGDLAGFINKANELKCANTATYFRPNANSSRGEAFKIASCVAKLNVNPTNPTNPTTPVVTNGTVTVAAVGTPTAQYVPANASSVNVGSFKVTATNGDVTINSITVTRSGLGNSSKVTISVADKSGRISESRSVSTATNSAVIRLNNPIKLKSGESVDLSALASVDSDVNAQHQFSVTAVNGQAVTPVNLGLINTTSYLTSVVTVDALNTYSVTSGKNDQTVARVTLRAGTQDVTVSGFTLNRTKGVDLTRAFSNVNVYKNGTKVGTATLTSDKIIVSGLATDLDRNNSAIYELRADVIYVGDGAASDDITLALNASEDVSATEKSTGFATQIKGADKTGNVDLSSLDITVTRKTTSNNTNTVSPGTSNVVLLDGTITSQASFDVTKFTVEQTSPTTTLTGTFSSLTLTIDGVDYDLMNGDNLVAFPKVFDRSQDKFRVEPGTPVNVQIRGTLLNNAPTGKVQYNLTINDVKNASNGNITTLTNSKRITGNTITIQASTVNVKNATVSAPSGTKIYSNATDLEIGRFAIEAKADEVSVNKITISNSGTIASGSLDQVLSNVRLINLANGSTVATGNIENGVIKFNSVTLTVAKNTTANLKLVADTNGDLVATYNGQTFQGNVTIEPTDISSSTSSTTAAVNNTASLKTYTISGNAPTVKVEGLTLEADRPVAKVVVTNTDENENLRLNTAEIRVSFRATTNGTVAVPHNVCLRNVGSSEACGAVGTLAASSTGSNLYTFTITGSSLQAANEISSNNGTTEFEVFINDAPAWVSGDNVAVSVNKLTYGSGLTESYVGTAGASVTVTK